MTPARGDHDARRSDVSAAVWRVLADRGFGGLTLRAVAAELNASTGLLTHYFPNKRALLAYALDLLDRHNLERPRPAAERTSSADGGRALLRAVLLDILPLTPDGVAGNRIWVGSWDAALTDPELAADHAARYRRARERLTGLVAQAREQGELAGEASVEEVAAGAQSFVLGLVVQALFAPDEFPPERQVELLDRYLDGL
ncbi:MULTISPECIES: TetR/AcrR family transcriptional regulator [unclassified Kitasatospora]|uniref:TetR/AcrR family transcriptional regulator n=1 Tax=unclassified Kitasatospora TaxID=2633591 RepID=UPI000710C2D9|nr:MULTISPECIES: TetR/AcrR family transcriptional regulator [unclassified Kitasatospora]KQV20601.1 TetR family transcriptional regulator [Kitasatospora sp. Root107]KRB69068.1 TetR family transcriptional regulator [Kitasatospora sp. Root187]